MSWVRSHTISATLRTIGGEVKANGGAIGGNSRWRVKLATCSGAFVADGWGPTKRAAVAALEKKLRDCAREILSDEWDFES